MTVKREATYEDLLAVPDHKVAQIIDGELIVSPRPASPHARASSVLGGDLSGPFDRGRGGPGGWWILFEPELHFGKNVLVPDLAGWRRERMPTIPKVPYFELAPDWICEVSSPSTAGLDRVKKLPIYAKQGVRHVWLIDPEGQTLEALQRDGERWTVLGFFAANDKVRVAPFDAVEIELGAMWLEPPAL